MAFQVPLVMNAGQVERLQPGDTLLVTAAQFTARQEVNADNAALPICTPVYPSAAGSFKRAQANALATAGVSGLVGDTSIAAAAAGTNVTGGVLQATTAQWDAVITGENGGLVFGTVYYLDPANPGKLTATAPSAQGQVVTQVGTALSATDMDINIQRTILL